MGEAFVTFKSFHALSPPASKDAHTEPRPRARVISRDLGDKDAMACGKDRSRRVSGLLRDTRLDGQFANGVLLDLRELILASVLRSSFEPRPRISRRKPRIQSKASSRPDFRGPRRLYGGTKRRRLGSPSSMPRPWAKPSGCAAHRPRLLPAILLHSDTDRGGSRPPNKIVTRFRWSPSSVNKR